MSEKANNKIKLVLENILYRHSLGVEYPVLGIKFTLYELGFWDEAPVYAPNFRPVTNEEITYILEKLVDKNILKSVDFDENNNCWIDFPENFNIEAKTYLEEISLKKIKAYNKNEKIKIITEKGKVFLLDGSNKIKLSERLNTRKTKLIKHLSDPDFGVKKTIRSTIEAIKLPKDKKIPTIKIIEDTLKEIQSTMKQMKSSIQFSIEEEDETLFLKITKRKSG